MKFFFSCLIEGIKSSFINSNHKYILIRNDEPSGRGSDISLRYISDPVTRHSYDYWLILARRINNVFQEIRKNEKRD